MYYTDMRRMNAFHYNTFSKYGRFQPMCLNGVQNSGISCLGNIGSKGRLLAVSEIGSGMMKIFDLNTSSEVLRLENPEGKRRTLLRVASEDNLVVTSDNNCVVNLFDIRMKSLIKQMNNFKGSEELPISMDLEEKHLLLGTSEGPMAFDLCSDSTESCQIQSTGEFYKAKYCTESAKQFVTAAIGSSTLKVVRETGAEPIVEDIELDPETEIIDFETCKHTGEIAVVYKCPEELDHPIHDLQNSRLMILEPCKKSASGYKFRDNVAIGDTAVRVGFTREMHLCVMTKTDFSVYNCRNAHFVKALAKKVKKRMWGSGL